MCPCSATRRPGACSSAACSGGDARRSALAPSSRPRRSSSNQRPIHLALVAACLAAVAWGALAFGAVYPWAFRPLVLACGLVGLAALAVERRGRPPIGALAGAFALMIGAVAVQLVPLSQATLQRIGPSADAFLRQYQLAYVASGEPHALSIAPDHTAVGLMLLVGFALFLLGVARLVSATGARPVVRLLVAFGVLLAVIGIAQSALTTGEEYSLVYGFWKPESDSHPFGPFVNPNHFAGWMLMAFPLALMGFYDAMLRLLAPERTARDRMALLGSPDFGSAMVFGLACLVMGLSLVMTRSRSGLVAFAIGSALAAGAVFRRQKNTATKAVVAVSFLVLLFGATAWAGLDAAFAKFVRDRQGVSMGGRISVWQDTLTIIKHFPLTGSGLDTFGTAMVVYQTGTRELSFHEAHNEYLQIAAEGGLLLGLPVILTMAVFVREVRRRFREAPKSGNTYWLRVGAVIGMISVGLQSFVEFSLQMPGNAALFAVLAAIALHQSPNLRR